MSSEQLVKHTGKCHCGAVRFEVLASSHLIVWECNCSVCFVKRNVHFIVPVENFKLLQGKENLTTYTFNTHTAKHLFCKICGVQSFYVPRSNPDGIAVSVYCLDNSTIASVEVRKYDGKNWEESYKKTGIESMSKL